MFEVLTGIASSGSGCHWCPHRFHSAAFSCCCAASPNPWHLLLGNRASAEPHFNVREQKPVKRPMEDERRRQCLTHVPFAAWCEHCLKYRSRSDRHEAERDSSKSAFTLSFDFAVTGRASNPSVKLICLILKDSHTQCVQALPVPAKGGTVAVKYMGGCQTLRSFFSPLLQYGT